MSRRLELKGKKFGKLTVIGFSCIKNNLTYWKCTCACGKRIIAIGRDLKKCHTKSCGCLKLELQSKRFFKHGMGYKDQFYRTWHNMKQRCLNKNNLKYKHYGGRGIKLCNAWMDFMNFKYDMHKSYLEHVKKHGSGYATTIERKNNNKGYCKINCKWTTQKEQVNNARSNHLLSFNGITLTMSQWAKEINISYSKLKQRINKLHWSVEKSLTTK